MFVNITWEQYILTSALCIFFYYVFVALIFYRSELRDFATGKRKISLSAIKGDKKDKELKKTTAQAEE